MRIDLNIDEINQLAKVISELPQALSMTESAELSDLLETTVKYTKSYGVFTAQVDVRDGVGEVIETRTFYNRGLLKAMAYYQSAVDASLMAVATSPFLRYSDDWVRVYPLSYLLGYDPHNNGGYYNIVEAAQIEGNLEFRTIDQTYTLEEFLVEVVNV